MLLNCHSYYSLRYGTISIPQLIELAKHYGHTALALTDINTFNGMYDFVQHCIQANIKPLVGVEFRHKNTLLYIGLAKNQFGVAEMCQLLTKHNETGATLPPISPSFEHSFVVYPLSNIPDQLQENEYIGIKQSELNLLYQEKWKDLIPKMVLLHPVNHQNEEAHTLHQILRAIDGNTLLSKLIPSNCASVNEVMLTEQDLLIPFKNHPQIIANTQRIITECQYTFEFKKPRNKRFYTQNAQTDIALLTDLVKQGLNRVYGKNNLEAIARMEKELKVIDDLAFSGYFLITWDIIQYSKSMGLMHIGRGSGANSIVGYCLGITNVCPLELDLYFERFLNENRKTPPDFDIDWSWKDRNTILNYIFSKYGKEHVAFCGAMATFKYRSVIREIGKVYGLPKQEIDSLTRSKNDQYPSNSIVNLVQHYGQILEGFPNQRTMHSCGILISEEPISNYAALDFPPKGFAVAQFDMHMAEDLGFDKFDILSQRGIGHIEDAVQLIAQNKNIQVDINDITLSKDETQANTNLQIGNTIGCFYIESPAMRGLLRRLKCNNYKVLVAASSIIRPGVAQSGMMQEYIFRHNNPTQFNYFHDVFKEQLSETYGIMVYQEDVIKIALHYAGLPAADGDILRRAMSGKSRSKDGLNVIKQRFFKHCEERNHPTQLSEEIYRQIESFAGYSFCKAHSASYAIESYQSLYLKTYYPLEFITAVINNQGGFYQTEIYVHEAKMSGAIIHPPCINKSNSETTLEENHLYLGLMFIQGINAELLRTIITERDCNGNFTSLTNFISRIPIGIDSLQKLIFIGAFQSTGKSKNELLIQAHLLLTRHKPNANPTLLNEPIQEYSFPTLSRSIHEDAFDELEYLGFSISCTPFELLQTKFRGDVYVHQFTQYRKNIVRMVGYLITTKPISTSRGMMYFGTWIDAHGAYFDTVHFPDSITQYPFQGSGCYLLLGSVEIEYDFPSVQIQKMAKLPYITDPRFYT